MSQYRTVSLGDEAIAPWGDPPIAMAPSGVHDLPGSQCGRILVVEDEALIQLLLQDFLTELGFHADAAGSGAEALRLMQTHGDGIVAAIIDFGLPDMKGDELALTLRHAFPALPLLIASGHDKTILRDRLDGLEAIEFLGKPYTMQDMQSALSALGLTFQAGA